MTFRAAGEATITVACVVALTSFIAAQADLSKPQHFTINKLMPGPGRFQASMSYDWDQAVVAGKPVLTYQLNKHCSMKAPDLTISGNSGLPLVTGKGPHYHVDAICNCSDHTFISPAVRVYTSKAPWVSPVETPQGAMPGRKPGEYVAPCKQTK